MYSTGGTGASSVRRPARACCLRRARHSLLAWGPHTDSAHGRSLAALLDGGHGQSRLAGPEPPCSIGAAQSVQRASGCAFGESFWARVPYLGEHERRLVVYEKILVIHYFFQFIDDYL